MNKILFALTLVSTFLVCSCDKEINKLPIATPAPRVVVMSYNIRYANSNDGNNAWDKRKEATIDMLSLLKPDVFGVQEALATQVNYVKENSKIYDCVGVGRDDGVSAGEHMSVFWNTETIEMLEWGTFWLSETPDKPSKGWDAACNRTATWTLMQDKRHNKQFYFINTHLDHKGVVAQKNGLQLIIDRLSTMNRRGLPMVLTGDFNIKPDNVILTDLDQFMVSTRKVALSTDNSSTYNGFGGGSSIIDYIYMSGFQYAFSYRTVNQKFGSVSYISDHYPIMSTLVY